MNLQEQIYRINEMMGVFSEEQRKPSEEEFNQAIDDVQTIIPIISHRIIHEEGLEHNEETMIKLNKMILQKVKEGNDDWKQYVPEVIHTDVYQYKNEFYEL